MTTRPPNSLTLAAESAGTAPSGVSTLYRGANVAAIVKLSHETSHADQAVILLAEDRETTSLLSAKPLPSVYGQPAARGQGWRGSHRVLQGEGRYFQP